MGLSKEEYKKVLAFFRKAAREEPYNPSYWYDIGFCKGKLGHWQEAAAAFEKIIAEDPERAAPFNLLGHCYIKLNRYQDAINVLRRAIQLNPNKIGALYRLAAAYFYMNLPIDAKHAKANYGMGLIYNRLDEVGKMARQIKILAEINPQMADKLRQIRSVCDGGYNPPYNNESIAYDRGRTAGRKA